MFMFKRAMTGTLDTEANDRFFYEENSKYFEDKDGEMKEISKLQLALYISLYWSDTSIQVDAEEKDGKYLATMFIPIYDEIFMELYEEGNSKNEAKKNVRKLFDEFLDYYEKYEENIRKNEVRQLQNMKCFLFLPKDRTDFDGSLLDSELIYADDNTLDFRDLAISLGVPKDARADQPVFGYVENNKLVFFKTFFMQGQKDEFKQLIDSYEKEIANHYNLTDYEVYTGMVTHEEYMNLYDEQLSDSFLTDDFPAYYAVSKRR